MRTNFFIAMQQSLLAAICIIASTGVWASTVSNSAYIDLTTLDITSVSGNATLDLSPSYSFSETTVNNSNDFSEDSAGGSVSLFSDNGAFVDASAAVDQDAVLGQTSVESAGLASATALHELGYTVNGSGEVKISVDYTLNAIVSDLNNNTVSSSGLVELLDEVSSLSSEASIFNEGFLKNPTDDSGILSLILMLQDGDTGSLQFIANSDSFSEAKLVPIPSALLLFSTSLFGFFLQRRSKS